MCFFLRYPLILDNAGLWGLWRSAVNTSMLDYSVLWLKTFSVSSAPMFALRSSGSSRASWRLLQPRQRHLFNGFFYTCVLTFDLQGSASFSVSLQGRAWGILWASQWESVWVCFRNVSCDCCIVNQLIHGQLEKLKWKSGSSLLWCLKMPWWLSSAGQIHNAGEEKLRTSGIRVTMEQLLKYWKTETLKFWN